MGGVVSNCKGTFLDGLSVGMPACPLRTTWLARIKLSGYE